MRLALILAGLAAAVPLAAQTIVTSQAPDTVSVTIYRDPGRSSEDALNLEDLTGFALITETRTLDLPSGEVTIRFEGVASGIQPESAIVLGAPVKEKNRDRRLLSQRGLIDAFTGQKVIIRRTDAATGKAKEEVGTIRSRPDGLILQTAAGFESLYCTGLDQTLIFPGVPKDLVAKPTLSVLTRDQAGGRQTISLSYLAGNFDWQANYIAELSPDAKTVDLFAWLTMASADDTSFVDANAYAVAGTVSKGEGAADDGENPYAADDIDIWHQCWPSGTTTSIPPIPPLPPPYLPAPAPVMMRMMSAEAAMDASAIIVTGAKRAEQEDLGDLKLYRIPFAVTVAARSQKQVAFLSKQKVKGDMIYSSRFAGGGNADVELLYRVQNKKEDGLGEALPSGQVALFQAASGRRMLVGETGLSDKAIGEEVEFAFAKANNVSVSVDDSEKRTKNSQRQTLTVSNANPFPITYEAEFQDDDSVRYANFGGQTFRKKGKTVWRTIVRANGDGKLSFRQIVAD